MKADNIISATTIKLNRQQYRMFTDKTLYMENMKCTLFSFKDP